MRRTVARLEALVRANPTNFLAACALAQGYHDLHNTDAALQTLDRVVQNPEADANAVLQAAQQYAALTNYQRLEVALGRLTQLSPEKPEVWYDLAAFKAMLGKPQEALPALRRSLELSDQRLKQNPKALDLRAKALQDPRLGSLRQLPEFHQLTAPR